MVQFQFQDILRNNSIKLDWTFKSSLMLDIVKVSFKVKPCRALIANCDVGGTNPAVGIFCTSLILSL